LIPKSYWAFTKILKVISTHPTFAAISICGNVNSLVLLDAIDSYSDFVNVSGEFMAEDYRRFY